jgi:hypothetical protein
MAMLFFPFPDGKTITSLPSLHSYDENLEKYPTGKSYTCTYDGKNAVISMMEIGRVPNRQTHTYGAKIPHTSMSH